MRTNNHLNPESPNQHLQSSTLRNIWKLKVSLAFLSLQLQSDVDECLAILESKIATKFTNIFPLTDRIKQTKGARPTLWRGSCRGQILQGPECFGDCGGGPNFRRAFYCGDTTIRMSEVRRLSGMPETLESQQVDSHQ